MHVDWKCYNKAGHHQWHGDRNAQENRGLAGQPNHQRVSKHGIPPESNPREKGVMVEYKPQKGHKQANGSAQKPRQSPKLQMTSHQLMAAQFCDTLLGKCWTCGVRGQTFRTLHVRAMSSAWSTRKNAMTEHMTGGKRRPAKPNSNCSQQTRSET